MSEPKYEVLDITPEVAMSMLERNTHNRNVRQRVVDMYATDMAAGEWDGENGQSIVLADDGRVVDGQHRMWAIVQSGTTQRMLVVTGVPIAAQLNVDTQAKRKFGDQLKLDGEQHANTLAAVVRQVALWEINVFRSNNAAVSNPQLLATLEKYPELRESTEVAETVRRRLPIPGTIVGLCHWLFSDIDYDDCDHFFALLKGDHDGLAKTHPVRVLQDTIERNQSSSSTKLKKTVMTAFVIKAWNAYREGESLGLLRYKPGGSKPEKFPEPK